MDFTEKVQDLLPKLDFQRKTTLEMFMLTKTINLVTDVFGRISKRNGSTQTVIHANDMEEAVESISQQTGANLEEFMVFFRTKW